jgi:hypothetical protein
MTLQALSGVIALRLESREGSPSLLEVRHTHTHTLQQSAGQRKWPPRQRRPPLGNSSVAWHSCYTADMQGSSLQSICQAPTTSWRILHLGHPRPKNYFML